METLPPRPHTWLLGKNKAERISGATCERERSRAGRMRAGRGVRGDGRHGGRRMPVCAEPPAVAEKDDETLGPNGGQATATALATVGR